MDARSRVARFLATYAPVDHDEAERMVQRALDKELHEAAEKIRQAVASDAADRPKYHSGMRDAADLIDPEVKS